MARGKGVGKKAVFLDRDGTVIRDRCYLADAGGVELMPGATKALLGLAACGYALVLVTNQSGIGRGYFTRQALNAQHRRLRELLRADGVEFAAIEVCPHTAEDNCACRKPLPGMLQRAARRLGLDLGASFMVGDKPSDVQAGKAAGCTTVFIGKACAEADFAARDLRSATRLIIGTTEPHDASGVCVLHTPEPPGEGPMAPVS